MSAKRGDHRQHSIRCLPIFKVFNYVFAFACGFTVSSWLLLVYPTHVLYREECQTPTQMVTLTDTQITLKPERHFSASDTPSSLTPTRTSTAASIQRPSEAFILARGMGGRLGNQMFEYATAYALALSNNMTVRLHADFFRDVIKIFNLKDKALDVSNFDDYPFEEYKVLQCEAETTSYNPNFKNISRTKTMVLGYCQSWMYFIHVKEQIRRRFSFSKSVMKTATNFIKHAIKVHKMESPVVIGIHVRRGDHVSDWGMEYGYVVPNRTYFQRAMWYFDKRYINTLYLIISEDTNQTPTWAEVNIVHPRLLHGSKQAAEVDLAILSLCNHTILSAGSFGWWGAFLNGGEAVYFNQWPRPGSQVSAEVRGNEYFCPWWIGMPN
ncbi:galactoside 2-alpha-L-fucosyltransferase 2-like [Lingula anatina]|uniref:L-Fucosyltransferase n=1 Tax=Lingula anatina TaxID=7574 RepID=A0A1S3I1T3_LINAN|nr:galactoside 2-alpha-L-fucosyltransferase 2-like [Lingula anatina]|eukprot:XP_013391309.1 galactoside 2-alpha-L-fucosyltransferase 2-like [Lingula anatina]